MATENGGGSSEGGVDPIESSVKVEELDAAPAEKKWAGWPGDNVFRLIVPVPKVGSIIGKKGELIKKICEDTKARIRILDGVLGTVDRIVLISGKEEPEARLSPAMNAVIRVFKRINGLSENEDEGTGSSVSGGVACSARLLVASSQAINLIGKQGSLIKSIQESTTASVRVLSGDEVPFYATSEERVVDIQGESSNALKALEAVVGHLRKFLVDHSVIPLFEKVGNTTQNNAIGRQDHVVETWADKSSSFIQTGTQTGIGSDYSLSLKRDSLFVDRDTHLGSPRQHSGLSLYGQDPALSGLRASVLTRSSAPVITQMTQTMQIPLSYAEDIIGIGGANIGYIRRTSGAILTVQESRGLPDEITVELKGTSSQVQTAQQLIQDFIAGHRDPIPGSYGNRDPIQGSYGNRDAVPGVYGNRDAVPGVYGNRDAVPGSYGIRDPAPGNYDIRDPAPGSYGNRDPIPGSYGNRDHAPSSYGKMDTGLRSSYSQLGNTPYSSSSLPSQGFGGYGSSGLGAYSNYRL